MPELGNTGTIKTFQGPTTTKDPTDKLTIKTFQGPITTKDPTDKLMFWDD